MPILSKFKIRTPLDEFENFLGEEMNTFSGFFSEDFVDNEEISDTSEEAIQEKKEIEDAEESYWKRKLRAIFKFSSDLFL